MRRIRLPHWVRRRKWRTGPSAPKTIEFRPSKVDKDAVRREIKNHVDRLAPDAVDEATGHVLDRLIDARAAQWLTEAEDEHESYHVRAKGRASLAEAVLSKLEIRRRHDELRLAELRTARDAALTRMLGEPPPETPPVETGGADESGSARRPKVTPFGGTGYADPALLAGRTRGSYGYLVALLFAVGADISAFLQVVELVMPDQPQTVALVLVLGFTAIVLALAHAVGTLLRDRKAGVRWVPAFGAPLCALIWLALGLLAAWVRLKFGAVPVSSGDFSLDGPSQAEPRDSFALPAAGTFLALYLGSGLVAGLGAYLTTNRLQSAYLKSAKAHDRATRRVAATTDAYQKQRARWETQTGALDSARATLARQRDDRLTLAEELKHYTRVLISEKKKDPATTDILTYYQEPIGGNGDRPTAQTPA